MSTNLKVKSQPVDRYGDPIPASDVETITVFAVVDTISGGGDGEPILLVAFRAATGHVADAMGDAGSSEAHFEYRDVTYRVTGERDV